MLISKFDAQHVRAGEHLKVWAIKGGCKEGSHCAEALAFVRRYGLITHASLPCRIHLVDVERARRTGLNRRLEYGLTQRVALRMHAHFQRAAGSAPLARA